ncbi:MAG: hypothetical protein V4733_08560 [Verrucomicrobiota bacterium]
MNFKNLTSLAGLFWLSWGIAAAQDTPPGQVIPEEKVTRITCSLTVAPRHSEVPVLGSAKEAKETLGTYHYDIWLPPGYAAAPQKRWPTIFVMSPGGNAGMGGMAPVIREHGMICIMLVEAKNGPWQPIVGNFMAAHDDAVKRFRIADKEKIATGMSGGARGSSVFVQVRPGFQGLILQAAGPASEKPGEYASRGLRKLYVAMTMGTKDENATEVARLEKELPKSRFEVFRFEGGHGWAPTPVFKKALEWVRAEGRPATSKLR